MKTAHVLFGLAACAASPSEPQYPLCDRAGAPACGNIGQVGRAEQPAAGAALTRPGITIVDAVATMPARLTTVATRVLVQASSMVVQTQPVATPLLDRREEIVCGNVMSKGGSRRLCKTPSGRIVSAVDIADGSGDL